MPYFLMCIHISSFVSSYHQLLANSERLNKFETKKKYITNRINSLTAEFMSLSMKAREFVGVAEQEEKLCSLF